MILTTRTLSAALACLGSFIPSVLFAADPPPPVYHPGDLFMGFRVSEAPGSTECLLVIKTTESAFPSLRDALGELHSYEVPECVALSVTDGSTSYLKWMEESIR